jgi:hypothetical protein
MVADTMADGAATTVAVDFVARADGKAPMDSAGMGASPAAEDSRAVEDPRAAGSEAVTGFVVAAGSTEAAMVADPTAAEVAGPTAVVGAIDSR